MKKTLSILMLCSLLVMITAGTTLVYGQAVDSRTSYATVEQPVIDGEWTTTTEWIDGWQTNATANFVFRSTWNTYSAGATTHWIVEVLDDTTDDTGDYLEMSIDGDETFGTAPDTGDYKMVIEGDGTMTLYQGTGTAWGTTPITPDANAINVSTSVSDSPVSSTAHRIYEFQIYKSGTTPNIGITWNVRVAAYDDTSSGEQMWPAGSDVDVPDGWGQEGFTQDTIPEGFTFAVMAVLSSISLIAGSQYLRKRSKKK